MPSLQILNFHENDLILKDRRFSNGSLYFAASCTVLMCFWKPGNLSGKCAFNVFINAIIETLAECLTWHWRSSPERFQRAWKSNTRFPVVSCCLDTVFLANTQCYLGCFSASAAIDRAASIKLYLSSATCQCQVILSLLLWAVDANNECKISILLIQSCVDLITSSWHHK